MFQFKYYTLLVTYLMIAVTYLFGYDNKSVVWILRQQNADWDANHAAN